MRKLTLSEAKEIVTLNRVSTDQLLDELTLRSNYLALIVSRWDKGDLYFRPRVSFKPITTKNGTETFDIMHRQMLYQISNMIKRILVSAKTEHKLDSADLMEWFLTHLRNDNADDVAEGSI